MDYIKNRKRYFSHIISLPILYGIFIPILFLDICAEIYHRICFVLYRLKYVKRSNYIKIDRQKLNYLKWNQKIGCVYCGYVNGLIGYWAEIGAKTEKYWCGIMHEKSKNFNEPKHHKDFVKYGDEEGFKNKYIK